MNVLFVESAIGFGGSTVALGRLLAALDPADFRVHVATAHPAQRNHLVGAGVPETDIVMLPVDGPRATSARGGWMARTARRFAYPLRGALDWIGRTEPAARAIEQLARSRGVELIHLNNSICTNLAGALAARRLGVPCIVKQRGFPWPAPDVRWAARRVDAFLPSSACVGDSLLELGVPRSRIHVNYSPLDVRTPASSDARASVRAEIGIPAGARAFGMIACVQRWKGQHVFVEAAAKVLRDMPDAMAILVGEPPSPSAIPYARSLVARVAELGLESRVRFLGHRDDVPRILEALDVCIHASIEPEPFGLSVIEAMASGRPVVAAAAGGPLEYIQTEANGLLTPPSDTRALAEAILRLLRDRPLARRLGDAARRTVTARFGIAEHARITTDAYRSALASRR